MDENKETLEFFDKLQNRIGEVGKMEGDVVSSSQWVSKSSLNIKNRNRLSKTAMEARDMARRFAAEDGEAFDESETDEDELHGADERLVDTYVRDIVDHLFGEH